MNIRATHALIMFDCASGMIDSSIFLDEQGSFDITGIFIREGPGPVSVPPPVHPARYSGQVHRSTMSLTVTLIDTGEALGPFTLMHGQPGQLFACP